jgi:hypothetical protein
LPCDVYRIQEISAYVASSDLSVVSIFCLPCHSSLAQHILVLQLDLSVLPTGLSWSFEAVLYLHFLVLGFCMMDQSNTHVQSKAPLDVSTPTCPRRDSTHISRKTSWGTPIPPPSNQRSTSELQGDVFDDVDLNANCGSSATSEGGEAWNTLDNIAALGLSFNTDDSEAEYTPQRKRFSLDDLEPVRNRPLPLEPERPFNKWMRTLQRGAIQRRKTVSCDLDGSALERELFDLPSQPSRTRHKKSSSGSSFGFVTAVKSASISLASFSIAPRSRKTGVSSRHHRTDRSSKASNVGRLSEDSSYIVRDIAIDQEVMNRLLQRRRVLEEIITTEESYVADVKFLMNVRL